MFSLFQTRLLIQGCLIAVVLSSVGSAAVDFESVRRLRRQGLYRAAERKCFDLLESKLTESDRALTLVEYLRTVEAHISTTDAEATVISARLGWNGKLGNFAGRNIIRTLALYQTLKTKINAFQ